MTRSSTAAAIAALAALAVGVPVTAQAFEPSEEATMSATGFPLRGTWQVLVDPRPAPNGSDQPAFESTLAYSGGNTVSEATSRDGATSAGVGAWERTGKSTYSMTFQKYRYDSTGGYVGKTVITETIKVTGPATYESTALTKVVDPSGAVVAQFTSDATGTRLTP